jgi:ABC-type multidrug transport system ATPase subunit
LHEPKLLLLDEPTAGVDAEARREFWDLIHDMAGEGLTTLVSTHYMDEAERCERIVYLSDGHIVVQGAPDEVARNSGLVTYEATGEDVDEAARRLRQLPGIEAAAVFGRSVHVAGSDRAALERAISNFGDASLTWQEVAPRLEDVFIHLLSSSGHSRERGNREPRSLSVSPGPPRPRGDGIGSSEDYDEPTLLGAISRRAEQGMDSGSA